MKSIPSTPGIYVVSLSNEHPISVNADRAYADQCIFVTKSNCKFGRAQNLARRYRDYVKTFGVEYVTFEVMALTDNPASLEAALASRLITHRIRGTSGRMTEWLTGITVEALKQLIFEELATNRSATLCAPLPEPRACAPASLAMEAVGRPPTAAINPGASPSMVVAAATYLQEAGMPVELLRDLHHFTRRTETFASTIRYFAGKQNIGQANQIYAARLLYVEQEHRSKKAAFEKLATEALHCFPRSR